MFGRPPCGNRRKQQLDRHLFAQPPRTTQQQLPRPNNKVTKTGGSTTSRFTAHTSGTLDDLPPLSELFNHREHGTVLYDPADNGDVVDPSDTIDAITDSRSTPSWINERSRRSCLDESPPQRKVKSCGDLPTHRIDKSEVLVPGCSNSCDDARINSTPLTTSTELPETFADFWWPCSSLRGVVSENCVRRQRPARLDNRLVKSCGDLPAHRPADDHFLLPDFSQSCSTNDVSDLSDWTFYNESSSATAQSRGWWMDLEDCKPWEWSVSSASTSDLTIRTWSSTEYTTAIDSLGSSASTIIPSSFFSMPTTDCELSEHADEFDYDNDDDFEEEEESDYSLSLTVKTSSSMLELRKCAMKARNYEAFKQLAMGSLARKSPSEVLDALFHDYRELVLQRQWKWCGTDEFDYDQEGADWEVTTSDEEEATDEWDGDDSRSLD